MVIVEFCKYGNLSNYLRSKRSDFVVYKVSETSDLIACTGLVLEHSEPSSESVSIQFYTLSISAWCKTGLLKSGLA